MTYAIALTPLAQKQLRALTKEMQHRVKTALERIIVRPYPHVVRLVHSPYYRLRVGDYRIILDIREGTLLILVIEVGHRKDIYR